MTTLPISLAAYQKRRSHSIQIGPLKLGGEQPLRVQSMTTTDTNDTVASTQQCEAILNAGADLVRLTTQGVREAENLKNIRQKLQENGYEQALVADVHFNAKVAFVAAEHCQKVRINPGNFIDPVKRFQEIDYTEEEYQAELQKIEDRFVPFLERCKVYHTAIRIGVNHGSLSDRIMSRFGDTAQGMVESCMEYLRIAVAQEFSDIVISIKASNTRVMVQTVRLLVQKMNLENMSFPLHLGVTEAGEGEDGRIKSAVGIGALLADGIGDTIRVSLSEDPEKEIPVCNAIKAHFQHYSEKLTFPQVRGTYYNYFDFQPRKTIGFYGIGGGNKPVVATGVQPGTVYVPEQSPEWVFHTGKQKMVQVETGVEFPVESPGTVTPQLPAFVRATLNDLSETFADELKAQPKCLIAEAKTSNVFTELRTFILKLDDLGIQCPVLVSQQLKNLDEGEKIRTACDFGGLFIDGLADGIMVECSHESVEDLTTFGLALLQASRARFSKTEFISCPGCGRTLFNLQETIAKVKKATGHLKELKIGVMGCIVNGPGEMADADFGYVGAGKGRISLYKGKECVKKGILEDDAIVELIQLIKQNNQWVEPQKPA